MSKLRKFLNGVMAGGAGVAALATVNAVIARSIPEPEDDAPGGEASIFPWRHGQIVYRVAGAEDAPPLLFVHGVGAGTSAFMWRRNFDALAEDFRVYAPDLLGFGASAKPANAPYSADLYVELIADFLRQVVGGRPAIIVAGSLGAAFAVRVADEHPALVASLVLTSPTGFDNLSARPGMRGAAFYGLLHSPVLGTSFYNAVASERSIRDYARKQLFYDKRFATKGLTANLYAASHQPGAQHAMAAFLSGLLNTDIHEAFARLRQQVTMVWGREDTANPVAQAATLLRLNPHAHLEVFDQCRMMPQEEHAEKFNDLLRATHHARSAAA
ncbi:MAG: alpha/beta fold hydrolase [Acidobacteriota bacterium]|nr:alpha/beta fold hydrolase [Acidobacteriota bacterium]